MSKMQCSFNYKCYNACKPAYCLHFSARTIPHTWP